MSLIGAGLQALAIFSFAQGAAIALSASPLPNLPGSSLFTTSEGSIAAGTALLVMSGICQYFGTSGIYDTWRISQSKRIGEIHFDPTIRSTEVERLSDRDFRRDKVAKEAQATLLQSGQAIRLSLSAAISLVRASIFALFALLQSPFLTLIVLAPTALVSVVLAVTAASGNALRTKKREALRSPTSIVTNDFSDSDGTPNESEGPVVSTDAVEEGWSLLFDSLKRAARTRALMASLVLPALVGATAFASLAIVDQNQMGTVFTALIFLLLSVLQVSSAMSSAVLLGRFSPPIARYQQARASLVQVNG